MSTCSDRLASAAHFRIESATPDRRILVSGWYSFWSAAPPSGRHQSTRSLSQLTTPEMSGLCEKMRINGIDFDHPNWRPTGNSMRGTVESFGTGRWNFAT